MKTVTLPDGTKIPIPLDVEVEDRIDEYLAAHDPKTPDTDSDPQEES